MRLYLSILKCKSIWIVSLARIHIFSNQLTYRKNLLLNARTAFKNGLAAETALLIPALGATNRMFFKQVTSRNRVRLVLITWLGVSGVEGQLNV